MNPSAPEVALLEADDELAGALSPTEVELARASALATVRTLSRGPWDAIGDYGKESGWLGLLILDGFATRETRWGQDSALEVVGPGDLLRPWDHDGEYALPAITTSWRVLQTTELALLDGRFLERVAPWPALTAELLARMGRRARWLAVRLTISQHPRVTVRVAYLFWHLAERWGSASPDGAVVPLRITHEEIGRLIGARRPSVSSALAELQRHGLLASDGNRTWRICPNMREQIGQLLRA